MPHFKHKHTKNYMMKINGINVAGHFFRCFNTLTVHLLSTNFNLMLNSLQIRIPGNFLAHSECGSICNDSICFLISKWTESNFNKIEFILHFIEPFSFYMIYFLSIKSAISKGHSYKKYQPK